VYNFARQPSLLPCWRLFLSNALPLSTEPTTPVELSIVVPMYNEAARVEGTLRTILAYLGEQSYGSEVIVVDDGSTDGTASIADDYSKRQAMVRVLRHDPNRGKGASIRSGVLAARGRYVFFMDADMSVPIEELTGAFAALSTGDIPVLIGSRKIAGARIERPQPFLRTWLGGGFTCLARLLLSPKILDFTCGFKGFRRDEAVALFRLQKCDGWAFDAEVLYLARLMGLTVLQYPVRWSHCGDSRVRFPHDIIRTLVALISIRWRVSRAMREAPVVAAGMSLTEQRRSPVTPTASETNENAER
jgi:dolichyl-phosphate beta-glucosyltransferase